jgi:hypothetical protein
MIFETCGFVSGDRRWNMSKIINLSDFKKEKQDRRRPPVAENFQERAARIKESLEKINKLMAELRSLSDKSTESKSHSK